MLFHIFKISQDERGPVCRLNNKDLQEVHVMRVRQAEEARRLRRLSAAAAAAVALCVVSGCCGGGLGSLVAEEGERALRTPVREVPVLAALQPRERLRMDGWVISSPLTTSGY